MTEKYILKLNQFEGPLDLLLHLIRVNEVSIFEVNLYILTSQYLEHLRILKFSDIKEAAAFIEMAANLIEIKSRRLLPINSSEENEEDKKDETEEESAEALRQRLFLYDTFRAVGQKFGETVSASEKSYKNYESRRLEELYDAKERPLQGEPLTLVVLYEQMLASLGDKVPTQVTVMKESIPLEEILKKLTAYIENLQVVLLQKLYETIESRYELVAYSLAGLQLVRDRQAKIIQEQHYGPLWIYSSNLGDDPVDKKLLDLKIKEHNERV